MIIKKEQGNPNPPIVNEAPHEEAQKDANKESSQQTMSGTEKGINKLRRSCTISKEMSELLVTQLRAELENYALYNTFAVFFNKEGLFKIKEYWLGRANEELKHSTWIRNYLMECNAAFEYPTIPPINIDITDRLVPFQATVDREIETTGSIDLIVKQSFNECDWATFNFLMGNDPDLGKLVLEQIEEEKISRDTYNIAKEDTDWLTKQDAIYDAYFTDDEED